MAISSFNGLNLSLRALLAEQRSIDTTAHNISNANTVGYTRQEAVLTAATPFNLQAGALQNGAGAQLGQGVDVLTYRRMRDLFGDLQFRGQTTSAGQQQTTARALDQAQDLLQEPTDDGLNAVIGKFFDAWSSLANQPESSAAKANVLGQAKNVVTALGQVSAGLTALQGSAASEITQLTAANGPIGSMANELGQLETSITRAMSAGESPNDLLDRRDVLLDQLSQYARVSVTDNGGGSISVQFGDAAAPLTNGATVTWPQPLTAAAGGKLGALSDLASATGTLGSYLTNLDGVASGLASSVNALVPGFFSGTTAATLSVAATSVSAGSTGAAGANDIALAVNTLRGGTAQTAYGDLVTRIGSEQAESSRKANTATMLAASADDRRQQVGGVSMDEEMTNLIRFQRGYQAASRALSTMDEMLDTLINRTGRVGL